MPSRSFVRTVPALVGATLAALVSSACSASGDGESARNDVPLVALMHVGTDHVPPSLDSLIAELEGKYGWSLPDSDVNRCLGQKLASCELRGEEITLIWKNLEPEAAEWQAKDFVRRRADVIVAYEDTTIKAAREATAGMDEPTPIVFLHPSDPLREGLVESLSRPDSNVTGVYGPRDVVAKQLELYELLVPTLRRVLTLVDPHDPNTDRLLEQYETAAASLPRPLELVIREVSSAQDLQRVFRSLRPGEVDGAFLLSPILRLNHSALTIRLARKAGLPVQAHRKEWVEQGALYSYGIDLVPAGQAGARYVDSILRGQSPADLPVEEIPRTEFAINLHAAARLGIRVPQDMIIRADQVYRSEVSP